MAQAPVTPSKFKAPVQFPYTAEDEKRLTHYNFYHELFEGDHFEAFQKKIASTDFSKAYAKIRYVCVNYPGMISRIVADMLFGEPVKVKVEDPKQQAWLEDFLRENSMNILCYESELGNSSLGDALFKLRVDARTTDPQAETTVIVDQVPPNIYFPHVDTFNVSGDPAVKELAWVFKIAEKTYLRREIHEVGKITNEIYEMRDNKTVGDKVPLSILGPTTIKDETLTKVDRHLLIHIPNWKTGSKWSGYSDYYDLHTLFYAINNRLTMVDNVLDKHTDPILMVPPGVIGADGKVKKKDGRVIEMGEGEDGKPEYIVWDASLENAFKEIEKMVEFIYMVSEISPDVLGMGQGQSDSGRALKFKLMRTLAKINRKKVYYDKAIKELLYVAQKLAVAHGATVNGNTFPGKPVVPELIWSDGIPTDEVELIDTLIKELDASLVSQVQAIMKSQGVDEATAKKIVEDIGKEKDVAMTKMLDPKRNPFMDPKNTDPKNMDPKNMDPKANPKLPIKPGTPPKAPGK